VFSHCEVISLLRQADGTVTHEASEGSFTQHGENQHEFTTRLYALVRDMMQYDFDSAHVFLSINSESSLTSSSTLWKCRSYNISHCKVIAFFRREAGTSTEYYALDFHSSHRLDVTLCGVASGPHGDHTLYIKQPSLRPMIATRAMHDEFPKGKPGFVWWWEKDVGTGRMEAIPSGHLFVFCKTHLCYFWARIPSCRQLDVLFVLAGRS
jgi:hypothetical protein